MKANRNFYKKDLQKVLSVERPEEFLKFWKIDDETITIVYTNVFGRNIKKSEHKSTFTKECKRHLDNKSLTGTFHVFTKNNYHLVFFLGTVQIEMSISSFYKIK